ncbi:type II toxin-antitoxin system VapC family toxin [Eikenella halliae]|uniref:Ribonuclease VapC n=1 Tax=Eikenella halliae TaxID=1795832 RepID=A0A1B6VZE5_9NEIS|nr:type II toxin-antitoxin system VapC family toxin [Eikenella halliae]OAM43421.1 plasmid stability protein StbB [Eikenella halliae]
MILVDTNVISETLRQQPDPAVVRWMDAQSIETLYLSAVTVAELRYGIAVLPEGRRRQVLHSGLEQSVLPLFEGRILPFDGAAAESYAELMAAARRRGRGVSAADGYIAATAHAAGLMVATRDTSPFEAVGLAVVNPWLFDAG